MNKKEIIINKVDVSSCYFLNRGVTNLLCTCPSEIDEECKYNPNCYFKQLQCKTAECKKYLQALSEIEEYCNEQNLKYDLTACEILSIIEKVKGE